MSITDDRIRVLKKDMLKTLIKDALEAEYDAGYASSGREGARNEVKALKAKKALDDFIDELVLP